MKNNYTAAALYDGGWRSTDRQELIREYKLSKEETDLIIAELAEMEADK